METNKKLGYELAVDLLNKKIEGTKIVGNEISTGFSYFEGKRRLTKILKSKKFITLEINVNLPAAVEKIFGLEKISKNSAKSKHLGSMVYFVNLNDTKLLDKLLTEILKSFTTEGEKLKSKVG